MAVHPFAHAVKLTAAGRPLELPAATVRTQVRDLGEAHILLVAMPMLAIGYSGRHLALLLALGLVGCGISDDGVEDLGTYAGGKEDTALPRTVELELAPGASKRYRITTPAFVANLAQDGTVDAQLTAKNYSYVFTSEVSAAPHVAAVADGTSRTWTLTVQNLGDDTLDATVVVDVPRAAGELGIVSDIDKTVLPPEVAGELPAPYPGIGTLLRTFELRNSGGAGDLHYVTARTPDGVVEIPAWMELHGVPAGSIDTGISGVPWVAQAEKIRDISRILDGRGTQRFVLFGDTSHRDPEVYAEIRAAYPDRIAAIFINKVNETVPPARVDGMHLVSNYAEAAAHAFAEGLLTEDEARVVVDAAVAEGLALTPAEIDALFD